MARSVKVDKGAFIAPLRVLPNAQPEHGCFGAFEK